METELLKIFDENKNEIGAAPRHEVHRLGYWHETFQCWFVSTEQDTHYIYLQLRSQTKKDYPNLFDITAAGHLLSDESLEDGVREIQEELGVDIPFAQLLPLGKIEYEMINGDLIDREIANVFLYKTNHSLNDFTLQEEEAAGMVKIEFSHFSELWLDKRDTVKINGFQLTKDGGKILIDDEVGQGSFVPHPMNYYETLIQRIKEILT